MGDEVVLYSKLITASEVEHQLNVSTCHIRNFIGIDEGDRRADWIFRDTTLGMLFHFEFRTRELGGYLKPYITTSTWRAYVLAKKLVKGDKVTFFKRINLEGAEEFMVRLERQVGFQLMGRYVTEI